VLDWLAPLTLDEFRSTYLQRAPIARPGSAAGAPLDWSVLDRVLAARPDVLVVARGQLLPLPPPRCATELRAYLRVGVGVCVRHAERCDPGLRAIADHFEAWLGSAQVQLFVTAGGTHGFGWHYDDEDVFIAQTEGVKDYYFRANTVTTEPAAPPRFARFCDERSTLAGATLIAGDFLYVPARWWHMAVCHQDAMSISVGVVPRPPTP
jgi:50S ribosomal protein L16 3-hydroxylase